MSLFFEIKRGDTAPSFRAQFADDTTALDLSGSSIRFLMRKRPLGPLVSLGPMTLDNQTTARGWASRDWADDDTANEGSFEAECEVTWPDGKVQTFPRDGYITINVVRDLG